MNKMKRNSLHIILSIVFLLAGCNHTSISTYQMTKDYCEGITHIAVYGPNGNVVFSDDYSIEPDIQYVSNKVLYISVPYATGFYAGIYVDVTNGNTVTYTNPVVSNGEVVLCAEQIGDELYVLNAYKTFAGEESEPVASFEFTGKNIMENLPADLVITNASIRDKSLYITRAVDIEREETEIFFLPTLFD